MSKLHQLLSGNGGMKMPEKPEKSGTNASDAFDSLWKLLSDFDMEPKNSPTLPKQPEDIEQVAKLNKLLDELKEAVDAADVVKEITLVDSSDPELFPKGHKSGYKSKGIMKDELIIVTSPWVIPADRISMIHADFHTRGNALKLIKCPNCAGVMHTSLKHYLDGGSPISYNFCYNCHIIWGESWKSARTNWEDSLKKYLQQFDFVPEYHHKQVEKLTEF